MALLIHESHEANADEEREGKEDDIDRNGIVVEGFVGERIETRL